MAAYVTSRHGTFMDGRLALKMEDAFGKYPIHFHLVGNVSKSFVRNCSIHHTFNRGMAIHGVDHLLFEHNVVFDGNPDAVRLHKDRRGQLKGVAIEADGAEAPPGFARIPAESIGLYTDPRRASWPVSRSVEPISLEGR